MILKNAKVLNTHRRQFVQRDLYVENGKIAAQMPEDRTVLDADGYYVIPGFIDSHIHGFFGCDFLTDTTGFAAARQALAAQGTTAFAATCSARPLAELTAFCGRVAEWMQQPQAGAKLCGIHSEGPFISEKRRGAMRPTEDSCSVENVQKLYDAARGALKLMTIAPERENVVEIIRQLHDRMCFSLGHTDATYQQALAAVEAGAVRSTHTFNGMRPLYHRETGILGLALTDDRICCEMIADFIHLDPPVVKLLLKTKGVDHITLISDAGFISGLPDGEYNGRIVKDGVCRNKEGTISGSCFSMLRGAQNLRSFGVPLAEISVMASWNPAKLLGVTDVMGSIEPGKCADFIVCDDNMQIRTVFIDGVQVKQEVEA